MFRGKLKDVFLRPASGISFSLAVVLAPPAPKHCCMKFLLLWRPPLRARLYGLGLAGGACWQCVAGSKTIYSQVVVLLFCRGRLCLAALFCLWSLRLNGSACRGGGDCESVDKFSPLPFFGIDDEAWYSATTSSTFDLIIAFLPPGDRI